METPTLPSKELEVLDHRTVFEEVQKLAQLGSFVRHISAGVSEWSDETFRMMGLKPNEQKPTTELFFSFIHPYDVERIRNIVEENLRRRTDFQFDCRIIRKDGAIRHLRILTKMHLGSEPQFDKVIGAIQDVTELVESQTGLRRSERLLRSVLTTIPSMIAYIDRDFCCRFANKAYGTWFGMNSEELIGKNLEDILGLNFDPSVKEMMMRALKGELVQVEKTLFNIEGIKTDVQINYVPDVDLNGQVLGYVAIVHDLTKQKENERLQRDHETQMINSSKLAALGEMAAGVAHEINNPLSIIQLKTNFLQDQLQDGRLAEYVFKRELDGIERTVMRIAKIVKGLRHFARNSDQDPKAIVDFKYILDDTLGLCSERFRLAGIDLQAEISHPIDINCRPTQISQVLLNLLNNAFDAVQDLPDKWVKINTRTTTDRHRIMIIDSGRGIAPSIFEKMMNPFFTTKSVGKGTGLGLSISTGIVAEHGGRLFYDCKSANTTFVIEIPRA